jgi:hypothetical protein
VGNATDDTSATVERSARGASPVLLVLAALCFLLPFVGVSCNTAAAEAALGGAFSQAGGSAGSGNAGAATSCLEALTGHDLATYSGLNLLTGSNPSVATSIAGCGTTPAAPSTEGGIGAQPLIVVAFLLILVGMVATIVRGPTRGYVAGGAALVAAVLIIFANSAVHTPIVNKLTASAGGLSLSNLGSGALGVANFLNIHPAIGFWLVPAALVLAVAANAVTIAVTSRQLAVPPPARYPHGTSPP